MYRPHPSERLNELFRDRPYQGIEPSAATFLFVGLDANYDPDLERSPTFTKVLEYHQDGAAFWQRYGVHHPFLLPEYRGDGRRYHRTFARIGFEPKHAKLVSFIELLHVPTIGQSELTVQDLDPAHLQRLSAAILHGNARHIFISNKVALLMRASKAFPWLPRMTTGGEPLRVLYSERSRSVYAHLHFSNYGKFQRRLEDEARAIASLLLPTAE